MKYILLFLFIVSLPSLSFANKFEDKMSKKEKKTYNQYVLRGELEGNMVFTIRNIKEKKGLVTFFDEFEDRFGVKEKGPKAKGFVEALHRPVVAGQMGILILRA